MQQNTANIFDQLANDDRAVARFVKRAHARLSGVTTTDLEKLVAAMIDAHGEAATRGHMVACL